MKIYGPNDGEKSLVNIFILISKYVHFNFMISGQKGEHSYPCQSSMDENNIVSFNYLGGYEYNGINRWRVVAVLRVVMYKIYAAAKSLKQQLVQRIFAGQN